MFKSEIKCAIEMKTIIWRLALNSYNLDLRLWRIEHERQSEKRIRALCFFL